MKKLILLALIPISIISSSIVISSCNKDEVKKSQNTALASDSQARKMPVKKKNALVVNSTISFFFGVNAIDHNYPLVQEQVSNTNAGSTYDLHLYVLSGKLKGVEAYEPSTLDYPLLIVPNGANQTSFIMSFSTLAGYASGDLLGCTVLENLSTVIDSTVITIP